MNIEVDREAFLARQKLLAIEARQRFAFQMSCGMDISKLDSFNISEARALELKLVRLIERERQRGLEKHWSYDLNRHIAMTQALDRIRQRLLELGAALDVSPKGADCVRQETIATRRARLRVALTARRLARRTLLSRGKPI
ncbi:hypothetical protein [Limoniibacter endophyticus]|uniref:Uncharacterized protein n=1 Tax=Limoniibacter endophyticus TaxID=1565040 RepID=A0A8J3DRI0_9HYPH|nr:hypothetical protein [Limoniibacter endophyticus]GHC69588.1 hypothetical protein GCM10010136_15580 [Limoniibacter endophyticus]